MDKVYIVMWSGGYGEPQLAAFETREAAAKLGGEWVLECKKGDPDWIQVFAVSTTPGEVGIEEIATLF